MVYLYILKSINYPKLYIGITKNLERRLGEHNAGSSTYTKRYKPWKIIYTEDCSSIEDARKREKYFKNASGRQFIKQHIPQ